jgi:hypothetical protein
MEEIEKQLEKQFQTGITDEVKRTMLINIRPFIISGSKKLGLASLFFLIRRGTWHLENGVFVLACRRLTGRVRRFMGGGKRNMNVVGTPATLPAAANYDRAVAGELIEEDASVMSARIKAQALVEAARISARSVTFLSLSLFVLSAALIAAMILAIHQGNGA